MNNEPRYRFFCLPTDIDINDYVETIDWGNSNPQAHTVLPLTLNDVEYYQEINLWYIISEQTDNYLLGPSEDDSIHDIETIQKVYDAFVYMDIPKDKNVEKMMYILKYAIHNNRDVFIHT